MFSKKEDGASKTSLYIFVSLTSGEGLRHPWLVRARGGERGGNRTHDTMIKSHVLYRLSYALPFKGDGHSNPTYD